MSAKNRFDVLSGNGASQDEQDEQDERRCVTSTKTATNQGLPGTITEENVRQFQTSFPNKMNTRDYDGDSISVGSTRTASTSQVSCMGQRHAVERMNERQLEVSTVQRTKKYGQLTLQLHFEGSLDEAVQWATRLASMFSHATVHEPVINDRADRPRVEIEVLHESTPSSDLKRWLVASGFFHQKGNRIVYSYKSIKVVEGMETASGKIKVVTVIRSGIHKEISFDDWEGRMFLESLEDSEKNADIYHVPPNMVGMLIGQQGKTVAEILKSSRAAKIQYCDDDLCVISGEVKARLLAWQLILMLIRLNKDGLALKEAPDEHKMVKCIVLEAVQQNGSALAFASSEMRNNKEIVLAAVKKDGLALQHASAALQAHEAIVLAAVQQNGSAFQFASAKMRKDKQIVLAAVKRSGLALQFASAELQAHETIAVAAVEQNVYALQFASELQNKRHIVLKAVKDDGLVLQYASAQLKADKQVVLKALEENAQALKYVSDELTSDKDFMMAAISKNKDIYKFSPMPPEVYDDNLTNELEDNIIEVEANSLANLLEETFSHSPLECSQCVVEAPSE